MVKVCNIDPTIAAKVLSVLTKELQRTIVVVKKSEAAKNTTIAYLQALAYRLDVVKVVNPEGKKKGTYWRLNK